MMNSFQEELPSSRVNITLDVETDGALQKKELPFKLLLLGRFGHGGNGSKHKEKIVRVTRENFDKVLEHFSPELRCVVEDRIQNDGSELPVNLTFRSLKDFRPEAVARQVPALSTLLSMRNLLTDFRSHLIDNRRLRTALEEISKDRTRLRRLQGQVKQTTSQEVMSLVDHDDTF